ncbi:MAG TPA: hypothetical protein DER04_06380 [Holosporales bacterium]|nr:hypothetical protein [Holosporales bacterium]HCE96374.1 hypothetical protein [Holosporales bacterium]
MFGSSREFGSPEQFSKLLSKSGEKLSAADYLDTESLNKLMQKEDHLITQIFNRVSNELEAMGAVSKKAFWQVADHFLGTQKSQEIRIDPQTLKTSLREETRAEELFQPKGDNIPAPASLNQNQRPFFEAHTVEEALKQNMAAFADDVFSSLGFEPHQAFSSSTQRRYGKKGHITVNLKTGSWIDFKDSDMSGGPLHILTKLKGLSFKEAVEYGASWAGLSPERLTHVPSLPQIDKGISKENPNQESKTKIAKAQALWNKGQSIEGTLAERYLREHRKIEGDLPKDLRYLPSFYDRASQTKHPCLMATARNPDGQVTAVQLTFLDSETGKKASLDVAKKSFGVLKGSAVILQENPSGPLFIAEGVETALSLKSAGVEGTIQANLGLSNIKQLSPQKPETPVVICADHDEPESPAAKGLEKSVQTLQDKGFHVTVIKPEKLNQDFNDVLKEKGPQGVREILQKSLPEHIFQNQVAQENPFDKIRLICEKQLYDYLKSENRDITQKLKNRIALQSEKAADFIWHQHQESPTPEETKLFLLRAKYELDRIPEIRKDLIEKWKDEGEFKKKDALLAHMIAERQASIEGRLYFETKKAGKEPSTQIPELAEKELRRHQAQTKALTTQLSQEYSLSKDAATNCAKDVLRYKETHGENPSQKQVETFVHIAQDLEKTYPYKAKETQTDIYLRRQEGDLLFRQMSIPDKSPVSPDMNKTQDQAKVSLESISLQMARDLQKMNQMELGL